MMVTVLFDTFPSLSETFLYTTILNWQKAGLMVKLLARKRGQAPHDIPFQAEVIYLPSESSPAVVKLMRTMLFLLRLCLYPRKLRAAVKCLHHGNGIRQKLQLASRCFSLFYHQTEVMYFPFGGLAVRNMEYLLATEARVILSLRGSDIHIEPLQSPYRERLQQVLARANGIHCVSGEIKMQAERLCNVPLDKALVIHTALSPEYINLDIEKQGTKLMSVPIRIVSVGRLDWRKGFEHGMMAVQELQKRGVNFHWKIIGDGEHRLALQWAIRDMNLQENVSLCGAMKQEDVLHTLQTADVFFHPSIHEGISNAVLEAMAIKLPVVACDVGGMKEAIPSESVGFLVPPRHWKAMADRLEQLAMDPRLREQVGSEAQRFVCSQFTAERQTVGFLELFHQVMHPEPLLCE
jgi:colanic acid/amylovoran biosynthesis glycosyltransferase